MKRLILTGFLSIVILICISSSYGGTHTENFTDFSGYDPYQSTAYWNVLSNRLEIHPIETFCRHDSTTVCPEISGGWYYHSIVQTNVDKFKQYLQHFDSDGNASWPVPGIAVNENSSTWMGSATALTNGDVLVVWIRSDDDSVALAQRYDISGTAVWPDAVRINHTGAGFTVTDIEAAQLPANQAAVAFIDNRTGVRKVYLQKISSNGNPIWSTDHQLQLASVANESQIDMDTDTDGNIFVCWIQGSSDYDIAFTYVDTTGTVVWEPAKIASINTMYNQLQNSIAVLDGEAVIISWVENNSSEYRLETQRWEYSGICLAAVDKLQYSSVDQILKSRIDTLATGNVLVSCLFSYFGDYYLICNTIKPDMTPNSGVSGVHDIDELRPTLNYVVNTSTTEGAVIVWDTEYHEALGQTRMQKLDNLGLAIWPSYKRIRYERDIPYRYSSSFTKNSGVDGGFDYVWGSNRASDLNGFGCTYVNPVQQNHIPIQLDSYGHLYQILSTQAADGTIAAAWSRRSVDKRYLEIMWFDSSWQPLWEKSVIVRKDELNNFFFSSSLDVNDTGHVGITWVETDSIERGVYFQRITREHSKMFSDPIRVDPGILAGNFYATSLQPGPDGSDIVMWIDNVTGGYNLWVQRIMSDGTLGWSSPLRLTGISPDRISGISLEKVDDIYFAVYIARNAGTSSVYSVSFDSDGHFVNPTVKISDDYTQSYELVTENLAGNIFVAWNGKIGSDEMLYGQKLVDGVPVWIDRTLSATQYDYIRYLDIIKTGTDSLAFAFIGIQGDDRFTLIQEMDANGSMTYGSERLMFQPEPAIYSFEWGISSQLNSGEDIAWATVTGTDDPRGGVVQYWLSNNGGTDWYRAIPGIPIVFPVPGNDLRTSADMYSEPYQQVSPEVTSITTSWNEGSIATDIVLNQEFYYADDAFLLSVRHSNSGPAVMLDRFIVLDVYSYYWFWPSWSEEADFGETIILPGFSEDVILDFIWPEVSGVATDLYFWAALLDPDTSELVGPWDFVSFGYGE